MHLWKDRRLRLAITRLGAEYLCVLLCVGAFAVNTGNNLLYAIFSLMLGLFLVSGWVSREAIRHLSVTGVKGGSLFARVRGGVRVELEDGAPRRTRGLELRLGMERTRTEPAFYAGGGRNRTATFVVVNARPERRGWCALESLEIRTVHPFGFLEKAWRFPLEGRLLVLPHPGAATASQETSTGHQRWTAPKPGSASPDGARPYRAGDAPGRIHWKRTAQRGAPWVRTFDAELAAEIVLRLDLRRWREGLDFELELERLSGQILQARLLKRSVSLEITGAQGHRTLAGYADCWQALALAQPEGN